MTAAYASAAAVGVANLGATDLSVPKPTGAVAGDLVVVIGWSGAGAVCTWTDQSGLLSAADASNSANGVGVYVFHRVLDGSETWPITVRRSSTSNNAGLIAIRITGASSSSPVAAAGVTGASSTTVVLPTVTAANAGTELLQVCLPISLGSFTWTPPSGAVQEAIVTATGTALNAMVGDETVGAGATGTRTWTHTTATTMRGAIIAINPATSSVSATAALASTSTLGVSGRESIQPSVGIASTSTLGVAPYPLSQFYGAVTTRETARVNVAVLGASGVEGYPAPFLKNVEQKLATKLRASYPTSGNPTGLGYIGIPSTPVQGTATTPVSWSSGTYNEAFGWGGQHGVWYTTPAQNATIILTLPAAASRVAIDILRGTAGDAAGGRYRVNGGAWSTFSTLDTATTAAQVVLTQAFAAGDTIEVGYNAGTGNVVVTGYDVSNGDETKGFQVHTLGHSGYTIAKWNAQTGGAPQWVTEIIRLGCKLLILQDFGVNDGNTAGTSPLSAAAFKTALGSFIDSIRSAGYTGDLLLAATQDLSNSITFVDPWSAYVTAIHDTATAKGAAYVDHGTTVPSPPNAIYYSDGVHTNTNGDLNELFALNYMGLLAPPTQTATAALASTSSLGITGRQTEPTAAALVSTSALDVGSTVSEVTAVGLTSTSALDVTGTQTTSTTVAISSASTLAAGAQTGLAVAAALVSTSALDVATAVAVRTGVALVSTSSLDVNGQSTSTAVTGIASTSSLSVAAVVQLSSTVGLDSVSTLGIVAFVGILGRRTTPGPTWSTEQPARAWAEPNSPAYTYQPSERAHTVG